jgi:hypothetical protein
VTAGKVFFGVDLIQLKSRFVAFVWNGQQADAMHRTRGRAKVRSMQAKLVPAKIEEVSQGKRSQKENNKTIPRKARSG